LHHVPRRSAWMNSCRVNTKAHLGALTMEKPSRTLVLIMIASEGTATGRAMPDKKR
jgi:hypothetical protein